MPARAGVSSHHPPPGASRGPRTFSATAGRLRRKCSLFKSCNCAQASIHANQNTGIIYWAHEKPPHAPLPPMVVPISPQLAPQEPGTLPGPWYPRLDTGWGQHHPGHISCQGCQRAQRLGKGAAQGETVLRHWASSGKDLRAKPHLRDSG